MGIFKTNDNIIHNLHEICKNNTDNTQFECCTDDDALRANVTSIEATLLNLIWEALQLYLWIEIMVCSRVWDENGLKLAKCKNGKPYLRFHITVCMVTRFWNRKKQQIVTLRIHYYINGRNLSKMEKVPIHNNGWGKYNYVRLTPKGLCKISLQNLKVPENL